MAGEPGLSRGLLQRGGDTLDDVREGDLRFEPSERFEFFHDGNTAKHILETGAVSIAVGSVLDHGTGPELGDDFAGEG